MSQHDAFCDALGGAEDAGGCGGLVGGKEHDASRSGLLRGLGERERGQGVVGDGFEGVLLEEWNVLVGGGVEDELLRF